MVLTPHVASPPAAGSQERDPGDGLKEVLTKFVTDSMSDRPHDILEYMVSWGRERLHKIPDEVKGGTATAQSASRLSINPTPCTLITQPAVFSDTSDGADPEAGAEAANRLRHLAEKRAKRYHDIAQGTLDRYLVSLEDSDCDLVYIDSLRRKIADTRLQDMNARADSGAVAAQLEAVEKSEGTATEKARRLAALLREYEQRWEHEQHKQRRA
ncbi:hypothetical protein JKF63_04210 [Porcisia hertigi]|uniref:Uncharacterized protein n=1 Tax=Porcisia hertigi TaxID=2761500 RepID=A0A836IS33_9TRYP|nr:hypothetical protein JKF63_04210 [Porcisia hertigi]